MGHGFAWVLLPPDPQAAPIEGPLTPFEVVPLEGANSQLQSISTFQLSLVYFLFRRPRRLLGENQFKWRRHEIEGD